MINNTSIEHQYPLENIYPAGHIGVISLATDFNIEADLRRLLPASIGIFTSRVKNTNPLTVENLRTMTKGISTTADSILPGTKLDAMIYACTSGTVAIGVEKINELVHISRPDVPVTNPVTAALAAFNSFNAQKISILTPYTEPVNVDLAAFFSDRGFQVCNIAGFGFENDTEMTFISPQDIVEAAIQHCNPKANALFISCTALRSSIVIEEIEKRLKIPVISSNQVLAWHSLRHLGYPMAIPGYGRLLREKFIGANHTAIF